MKWALLLLLAGAAGAADSERLFFSRSFPGSVPPYIEITLTRAGAAEYREAADDELPLKFKLTEADTTEIFRLVEKLDWFRRPLESPAKVAFMGAKVFRYENGGQTNEVKFNYSEDTTAQALVDWFEKMAESASHRIDLERAAKYDHLGVMKALLLLQSAMDRNRIVACEQFLPMLDRVAKNETYMHTARERAAEIAAAIRAPKK